MKAKLDPAKDVEWVADGAQTELMRMLGSEELAAADIAYQLGLLAQNTKWGPIIINDDVIVPDAQISIFAAHRDFLGKSRDAAVRFAVAYLHATKAFNAAAIDPGPRPDIVEVLAQSMPMASGAVCISTSWIRRSPCIRFLISTLHWTQKPGSRRRNRSGTELLIRH